MQISHRQLADIIGSFDTAVIATFTAETIPEMVKKDRETKKPNRFHGRVTKISRVNGIVGDFDFENVVTNQRLREADDGETVESYEAAPRSWGTHVPNTGLVEHEGKLYVRISNPRSLQYQFMVDGRPATEDEATEIKRFLPVSKPSERHGTDKEIRYRNYTLTNIREFRAGGVVYTVVSDEANVA